jgi:hypothetical protein
MYIFKSEDEKLRHSFYKVMEHEGEDLYNILNSWSREKLIDWLSWNDRNGVYRDEESMREIY